MGLVSLIAVIILAVALRSRLNLARASGPAFAAVLVGAWLLANPHTPDLAAQVYRTGLFRQLGFAVWDEHWYAGHHLPGYSLLFPALGTMLGVRAVGAICALLSTMLFAGLTFPTYGRGACWGSFAFAVAAVGDIWLGRLAFALGVSLALAAGLSFRRGHMAAAVPLAALCAAASPVAGLLLGLAGLTVAVAERSLRPLLVLSLAPAAIVVPLALLFPEGGFEPFPIISFGITAIIALGFLAALPGEARLLRIGGLLYLLACLACLAIKTPIGSNIERYGVLLAAPLLLCALLGRGEGAGADAEAAGGGAGGVLQAGAVVAAWRALTPVSGLALCAMAVWTLWGPVRETAVVAGSPATSAVYYAPVEHFLEGLKGGPVRVEVPLTRTHWEAALLAPKVSLARGWEKQLDTRYDGVLLGGSLTAQSYEEWLHRQAVSYIALPDVKLDPSSAGEGKLISSGLPYLREVFSSAHWRIYAVQGATPLASGPGRLTALGHDSFALDASAAGSFLVRIHFTRYWTVTQGKGCVARGPEGFTEVRAGTVERLVVAARFSLGRAFSSGGSCG